MAYIIENNEIVAQVETDLSNGTRVQFAYDRSGGTSRNYKLVNSRCGKISRAKRWDAVAARREIRSGFALATPVEFWVV